MNMKTLTSRPAFSDQGNDLRHEKTPRLSAPAARTHIEWTPLEGQYLFNMVIRLLGLEGYATYAEVAAAFIARDQSDAELKTLAVGAGLIPDGVHAADKFLVDCSEPLRTVDIDDLKAELAALQSQTADALLRGKAKKEAVMKVIGDRILAICPIKGGCIPAHEAELDVLLAAWNEVAPTVGIMRVIKPTTSAPEPLGGVPSCSS